METVGRVEGMSFFWVCELIQGFMAFGFRAQAFRGWFTVGFQGFSTTCCRDYIWFGQKRPCDPLIMVSI